MSLRSPLGRVLGLGSAKDGTSHWWSARLTALALVPLSLWFVIALYGVGVRDYWSVARFVQQPLNAILLALLVPVAAYHSLLGTTEVVEDYVHDQGAKVIVMVLLKFAHVLVAVAALYAVLKVSLGSSL